MLRAVIAGGLMLAAAALAGCGVIAARVGPPPPPSAAESALGARYVAWSRQQLPDTQWQTFITAADVRDGTLTVRTGLTTADMGVQPVIGPICQAAHRWANEAQGAPPLTRVVVIDGDGKRFTPSDHCLV